MTGNHGRSQHSYCLWALITLAHLVGMAHAESLGEYAKARFSAKDKAGTLAKVEYSSLRLHGGSELTIVSPRSWRETASTLIAILESTHLKYRSLFGDIPKHSVTVRLLDEDTFYLATGAPSWTNAMFFKGQIIIPVPKSGR